MASIDPANDIVANSRKDQSAEEQEKAVGITVFVSPSVPGFQCTIKHRYTDFLVNEISPSGQTLHLTDLSGKRKNVRKPNGGAVASDADAEGEGAQQASKKHSLDRQDTNGDAQHETDAPRKKPKLEEASDGTAPAPTALADDQSLSASIDKVAAEVSPSDQASLKDIFGTQPTEQILQLHASIIRAPHKKPRDHPTVKSDIISDKSKRTEAHVAIRRIFAGKLETATLQDQPGVISIKAASTKGPSGARARQPIDPDGALQGGKVGWEDRGGEYLHFSLYKENKDTMEVLYFIASRLKVPVKNFQIAGTKDRRAVTVQRVAIFRVLAERIAELNSSAKGWRAGDFEYQKRGLELGELGGNEFLLTLRDCRFQGEDGLAIEQRVALANDVLWRATESFKQHGFLNYFGLQRFGSFSTGTHATGQSMLSGDLEGAVQSILAYSKDLLNTDAYAEQSKIPQDDINRAQAISLWEERKTNEALKKMPKRFQAEAAIIQYLGKKDRKSGSLLQDRDWQGALTQIPRNLRMMYVHAYQSFIWNTAAGKRWEMYRNNVVEGDLVIVGEKDDDTQIPKTEVDQDGEPIFHPSADDSATTTEDAYARARHLTKDEAASGKYTIFDIVLPLPGYDVLYPANEIGEFYKDFMASEAGGKTDPHNMRRSWRDISLSGAYRKILATPGQSCTFDVKSYTKDSEQMVETDLERLRKLDPKQQNGATQASDGAPQLAASSEPQKIAVVLKLQLGSSQYATMALRELTKGGAAQFRPDFSTR